LGYRITVDTGGTFTDVVVADEAGAFFVGKAPTTRERVYRGVHDALRVAAAAIGSGVSRVLRDCDVLVYSATTATNAIIEGTTARTALLVTEGFRDVLTFREGGKSNPFDFATRYPDPYVPRRLTWEIRERIDAEGGVVVPLDQGAARRVLRQVAGPGVEAVAVCLLWSIANPEHELTLGRLLRQELPDVPYTLSHQLNPIIREYRRASSAAIDASLKPLMQTHLQQIRDDLGLDGFRGELLVAASFGGVMHVDDVTARPVHMVRSGPALAPLVGQTFVRAEAGIGDAIVCDTGGTSFDVSLVRGGAVTFTRDTWLGQRYTGHLLGMSSVDARSVGAGGGSIAWLDGGGLLRVGPRSAGADPGPACYGRGGDRPTVTDAATVLGYLNPDNFLNGRMRLDTGAANRVLGTLAHELGTDPERAAHAVFTIANEHMVRAIEEITVNEGVDPRESLVVAGGGAAGLTIVPIARELGCREVLLPRTAGALSATGAQYSDVATEFAASTFAHSGEFDFAAVNTTLQRLQHRAEDFAARLRARGVTRFSTRFFVEARYAYQSWELEVPLDHPRFDDAAVLRLVEAFHRAHERVFAVREDGQLVECVQWKVRVTGFLARPPLRERPASGAAAPVAGHRPAFFAEPGCLDTPVYRGPALTPGMTIQGPAIIEEPTTTVVLDPASAARVTGYDNYLLTIGRPAAAAPGQAAGTWRHRRVTAAAGATKDGYA
jgi:N-methylhydantoinase A